MRYFELTDDLLVPDRWHLGLIVTETGEEPRLRVGLPYHGGKLTGSVDRDGKALDFSLTSFAVPVANKRLAEVVGMKSGQEVQRIPVSLDGHEGFEVLNALRLVACLDETRSTFTKWTEKDHRADLAGQYRMVTELHLLGHRIPQDAHFFRVDKWPVALIVSELLRTEIEQISCVGARFVDVT